MIQNNTCDTRLPSAGRASYACAIEQFADATVVDSNKIMGGTNATNTQWGCGVTISAGIDSDVAAGSSKITNNTFCGDTPNSALAGTGGGNGWINYENVTTPNTCPNRSESGPPEFPGLMAASI